MSHSFDFIIGVSVRKDCLYLIKCDMNSTGLTANQGSFDSVTRSFILSCFSVGASFWLIKKVSNRSSPS